MNKARIIRRLKCLFRKHELKDEPEFRCYIRNGRKFVYHGRIFRCKRCNQAVHLSGIMAREIKDVIAATLKDLPAGEWSDIFGGVEHYKISDFYKGKIKNG